MKNTFKNNICCFVSPLFAGAFFLFACYHFEVFPFGSEYCLFKIDLVHQYAPMLTNLYDLIKEGKSITYSWNAGLGYSFIGNFFTYIASPFNLLVLLFNRENIPDAVSIIILIKTMLIAGSFSYYIKRTFEKTDAVNVGFSLLYAFSGWFVAYNWNIMWLDVLFCLPLAAVGVQKIIKEKKYLLYILTLSYTMFTSYYMAYMLCLFLCLYFIYYYVTETSVKKDFSNGLFKSNFFKSGITFAVSSVAAACIAAVALVPVFLALKKSSAVIDTIEGFELYFNPLSFWAQHFSGVTSVLQISGKYDVPNIWCGMLTVLLLPLYFLSKGVSKKERVSGLCLWLFMILSLGINLLCFVWCGFHIPNGFGDRFSFIYIFITLSITFKALLNVKNNKTSGVVISSVCAAAFILSVYFTGLVEVEKYTLIISIGFTILWTIVYFISKLKKLDRTLLKTIVLFFICAEIVFSQLENFDFNYYRNDYDGGSQQKRAAISAIKEKDSDLFFRTESADISAHILPMIVGYDGVSDFSSATNYQVAENQCALGLSGNWENQYTYFLQTPVYNSIFGLKYIMDSNNILAGNPYFEPFCQVDGVSVYKNRYCLPLGFCVDGKTTIFNTEKYDNPFFAQNYMFSVMCGENNLFNYCEPEEVKTENVSLEGKIDNKQTHSKCYVAVLNDEKEDGLITFRFTVPEDGEYYISSNYMIYESNAKVTSGENEFRRNYAISNKSYEQQGISCIGQQKKGSIVNVAVSVNNTRIEKPMAVYLASFNRERFTEGYSKLSQHTLELTEFENTHFKGTVTADENCLLFTSIPFDKGWHITVDGKPIDKNDVVAIDDAYISVPLTEGEHTVEFDFFPQGLKAGICISALAVIGLSAYLIISGKKKKQKEA